MGAQRPWLTRFICLQVIDCKTMQLRQTYRMRNGCLQKPYRIFAALPAGRLAAGAANLGGIHVLALEMAGSDLAPAGDACHPNRAAVTMLSSDDELNMCATGLSTAVPDKSAINFARASRVAFFILMPCKHACSSRTDFTCIAGGLALSIMRMT